MLKRCLPFLLLLFIAHSLFSQKKVDSTEYYASKVAGLVLKMSDAGNKVSIGLGYGKLAVEFATKSKNNSLLGMAYRKVGNYYLEQSNNFSKAFEFYCNAIKIYEREKDEMGIAGCYNNIGNMFDDKADFSSDPAEYQEAIHYHLMALKIRLKNGQKQFIAQSYLNIGNIYSGIGDLPQARTYFINALQILREQKDGNGLNLCLLNLADLTLKEALKSKDKDAFEQARKAYTTFKENYDAYPKKDFAREVQYTLGMAVICSHQGDKSKAMSLAQEALKQAKELGDIDDLKGAYLFLHEFYEETGNYAAALQNYKKYIEIRDSLTSTKSSRNFASLRSLNESDQKESEIELLKKDKFIKDLELLRTHNQVNSQRTISIISLSSLLFIALLIYIRYRSKKSANEKLALAYELIERKNKHITDSINYARRIQNAILPEEKEIRKYFDDALVFFRPKAIVSGDFFWFTNKNGWCVLAAADCTGHGVPGAFMSIIGNTLLNEIVNEKQVVSPVQILQQLNKGVSKMLNQTSGELGTQDDGMDISICAINQSNGEIRFAGANQSLCLVDKTGAKVIEGDLYSIGGMFARKEFVYTEKILKGEKGAMVYLFTDGFQDQFGGKENKKYLSSHLTGLLGNIRESSMLEQRKKLETEFDTWKGNNDQIDDVLIVGIKL
jgi:serine phosphatase RsbU (regulator of sigma subunit)